MKLDGKSCLRLCGSLFLLFLCIHYWDGFVGFLKVLLTVSAPLLAGCVIAYIVNLPMAFFERHYFPHSSKPLVARTRRPVCMLLAFASVVLVIFLVLRIVIPEVSRCVALLLASVPPMLEKAGEDLSHSPLLTENFARFLQEADWENILARIAGFLKNGVGTAAEVAVSVMTAVVSGTANFLIGVIFAIYLLAAKECLGRQVRAVIRRFFPAGLRKQGRYVLTAVNDCFHRYIVGQCTEAVILGVLCAVGMLLFGFPYAAVVGATVGLTALIPVAGAYIGGAVGFLLILTISPVKAVLFVVYLVVLQQFEGNIIYPRVVGTSLGLPGIWVLTAVIVGGGLGGIPGMVLSVPLTACVYRLLRENIQQHQNGGNV